MTAISIAILAFAMSIDAFVVSLGRGAVAGPSNLGRALRTGAIFGAVEAAAPLAGWTLGLAASSFVTAVDHWIAFGLLAAVGVHMTLQALSRQRRTPASTSTGAIMLTAVGTSVDAMAVGVSLAVLQVNILGIALAIGCATMAMSTTGLLAGRYLGQRLGRTAEILGGCLLIGLGMVILLDHLAHP